MAIIHPPPAQFLLPMNKTDSKAHAPQRVIPTRREYNSWVIDESIEDYALRYAPKSIRKWSLWTVTNTAMSSVSFLAMEAIGATMIWQYGFYNAFYALIVVSILIFLSSWPISYYAAKYNVDIDLLTRGAGFGYIGSTITSLIYASFTFIFLAFEAAIMAMALELTLNIPLALGYLISALIIIPMVIRGIDYINKIQSFTQPIWLFLLLLPWFFIFWKNPGLIEESQYFIGEQTDSLSFNVLAFGAACTLVFSLITQVGEQVDYLRFLPDAEKNAKKWSLAVFLGGPAWIIFGFIKIFVGMMLIVLALHYFVPFDEINNPTYLYWIAYQQVFSHPVIALFFMLIFVCISQIKINVTNAYAGSLAWSNFFARLTHNHPGRIIWLVFNVCIAILLMELGIIHAVERVLGLYSNIALAWIGAIVADLIICKPLGLSPKGIEFRRAYLYDINPVGVGALCIASVLSILCYLDLFGDYAKALAGFIALATSFLSVPIIAYITKGKYYLARTAPPPMSIVQIETCVVCQHDYQSADIADCPAYRGNICSLCCSLEARCHDLCKPHGRWSAQLNQIVATLLPSNWAKRLNSQLGLYILVTFVLGIVLAVCLSLVYIQETSLLGPSNANEINHIFMLFVKIYAVLFLLMCVAAWWLVLNDVSRRNAEQESSTQNQLLIDEIAAHEITDQQLQDARIQAETANAAKSRYLIGISHELRTPLNSILGYSQLIQKQEHLSNQGEMALGVISRSGQHLTALIDGLLDLARIETGKISLHMSDIQFPNFLQQIIKMFEPQFEQKNLKFYADIHDNIPNYVRIDQKRLEQILINLLGNALKFTSKGWVRFKVEYRFQTAYFEIADSGCGIAEQDIGRIFDPFERGSNVMQSSFTGTGLGLPIVKLLTELLGGQLNVQSQLNQGTIFKIKLYLPSKDLIHPIANLHSNHIVGYLGERRKILVVDNEAVDRGLVTNFLKPLGFAVEEAESGLHCLRLVPEFLPDLILMDLTMPTLDGWETARILRRNQMTNVPILIISADANERTTNPQTEILNEDFLVKPVDLNLLLNKIGDKLDIQWIDAASQPSEALDLAEAQQDSTHSVQRDHNVRPDSQNLSPQQSGKEHMLIPPISAMEMPDSVSDAINMLNVLANQGYIRGLKQLLSYCHQHFPHDQALWDNLLQHIARYDLKSVKQDLNEFQLKH